jgi:pimeloyl-ACP methyl ester carboxylesterase
LEGRPRILLCPQFTEVEWAIAPQIAQWADVATFDPPGVGAEEAPGGIDRSDPRAAVVERGLDEVDRRGWDSYFVVAESWGAATGVRLAAARPEAVLGLAFGHAALHHRTDGERPAVAGHIVDAMTQLLKTDYDSFVRYGITQVTLGSIDEATSARIVERFPDMEVAASVWEGLVERDEPIGDQLEALDKPMLFVKHEGCILFTAEGFDDAVARFPNARTAAVPAAPAASPEFADALRAFCEESGRRSGVQ